MTVLRDLKYTLRTFRREPAFVGGVVLTFALAIGANAAMFGLLERLMLAPPPGIAGADQVFRIHVAYEAEDGREYSLATTSYPDFRAVESLGDAFADVAAFRPETTTTGRGTELAEVATLQATGRYFATLGVRPALGRFFGPGDDELPSGNDVAVLGYAYWQRQFAADPGVIGQELIVDDRPLTIIGVAPRGFNGTELGSMDLFVPLTTAMRSQGAGWWSTPGMRLVYIVARVRDGVTASLAGEQAGAALRQGEVAGSREHLRGARLQSLVPGRSARESPQARIALWLSGVSLVVLLIAAANVGTLLLLRAARRRRDVAVRLSLGASRARLVRQVLLESVVLATIGAIAGLLLANWMGEVVRATLLPGLAPDVVVVHRRVLLVSIIAAVAAGLLAGLGPLAQLSRRNLSADLRTGTGQGASGRLIVQHALVGLQVALCTVLLVGAGLFVRSLNNVRSQDLGFSTARLLYLTLDFRGVLRGVEHDAAHEEAVRRILTVPGVTSATVVQGMPFSSHHIPPMHIPGYDMPPPSVQQLPIMYGATPEYLHMMGVSLREGRLFTDRDTRGAPLVVLVNETMAKTAWPGQSALGKCVQAGHAGLDVDDPMAAAALLPCRQVVGVVRDSRARSLRTEGDEARLMQYYVPFQQLPSPPFAGASAVHAILVETEGAPERLIAAVQRIVQSTSPVPVYARARPYQEFIDPQLRSWRLGATLFTALGALAVIMAAVGLYAVVAYLVTQRTQEIGVRLALGGTGAGVARLVVGDAVRMAALGTAGGLVVALAAAPAVAPLLFEVSARDPVSQITAAVMLVAVTIAAAAVPAWRASRVSAMEALRTDG